MKFNYDKFIKKITLNKISWVVINSFGSLKFSKSSYYYLVIVPILVKALDKIESPFYLEIGESVIPLNIELPFSWYLFYFGAVAIAIGSLIYEIFCPELIKNFKNYGEFLNSGESDNYLIETSRKYNLSKFPRQFLEKPYLKDEKMEKVDLGIMEMYEVPFAEKYRKTVNYTHNIKYQEMRKNYFNIIYNEINLIKRNIIHISFLFYIIGFGAFTWVIIQNIIYVVRHLL